MKYNKRISMKTSMNYDGDINHLQQNVRLLWKVIATLSVMFCLVGILMSRNHHASYHPSGSESSSGPELQYGDLVEHKVHKWEGIILGVDGKKATVRFASGGISRVWSDTHVIEWEKKD